MFRHLGRILMLALLLLILFLVFNQSRSMAPSNQQETENFSRVSMENVNLRSYFPINDHWTYQFIGEGNEFAAFTREFRYTDEVLVQAFDTTSGGTVTAVYRITENEVALVSDFHEAETQENRLSELSREAVAVDVILRQPLELGHTWASRNGQRQIVAVGEVVQVPAGAFYDVVVVKVDYGEDATHVGYEYYAKNIGLIKRDYQALNDDFDDFSVISQLQQITFR